jgi:acid phosphatase (class A)
MRGKLIGWFAAVSVAAAGQALAQAPAPALAFLTEAEIQAAIAQTPAPAPEGSPAAKAEIAELQHFQDTRTSEDMVHATTDALTENVWAFANVFGPDFTPDKLPAFAKFFADVRADDKVAIAEAKNHFQRLRPWVVDPTLIACETDDDPHSAYPSGHASTGYSIAAILVDMAPAKADAIRARADDFAKSRLVCEVHRRGDVEAGRTFGAALAADMKQSPAFSPEFAAAAADLQRAGLAAP